MFITVRDMCGMCVCVCVCMKNVSGELKASSSESAQTHTSLQIKPVDKNTPLNETSSSALKKQKKPSKPSAATLGHLHRHTPVDGQVSSPHHKVKVPLQYEMHCGICTSLIIWCDDSFVGSVADGLVYSTSCSTQSTFRFLNFNTLEVEKM